MLTLWRANLLGSSSKGNEYFLKHLLGTSNAVRAEETTDRSDHVTWREDEAVGKLDLLVSIDFRMTSSGLFGDILLPAATWYEKHDLSSTDMHPYACVHPGDRPAMGDEERLRHLRRPRPQGVGPGARHLDTVEDPHGDPAVPRHRDELAVTGGVVKDWKTGEVDLIPGVTAPKFIVTERDYTAIGAKMSALGPLLTLSAPSPRASR